MTSAVVGLAVLGVALLVLLSRRRAPDLLSDPQRPRAGPGRADSGGLVCGEPGVMTELPPGSSFSTFRTRAARRPCLPCLESPYQERWIQMVGDNVRSPDAVRLRLRTEGMAEVVSAFRSVVDASQGKCFELPKYQLAERHAARLGRAQLVAMNAHLAKEMRGVPGFRSSREEH